MPIASEYSTAPDVSAYGLSDSLTDLRIVLYTCPLSYKELLISFKSLVGESEGLNKRTNAKLRRLAWVADKPPAARFEGLYEF